MRLLLLSCIFVIVSYRGDAQVFGGSPPSLSWRQINTPVARIIFPTGMDSAAGQVAAITAALGAKTIETIGGRSRPINIVFRNQTTVSNGYVQLAPFRSEYELMPDQNAFELGSLPFYQTLAIHEFRHVQQYNNFRVGLSKAAYYLFGEEGLALANDVAVPNWFFEGDAVFQETLVSQQGRGRIPYYFNGYRSLWLSDKHYSWMKLRNGSLRDFVPDHYPLGYMLVAYGREKYGSDFWRKVSVDAAAFRPFFYPLQNALKKYSGVSFTQFRESALGYFKSQLPDGANRSEEAVYAKKQHHFVGDQTFPQFMEDGKLVFVSSNYRNPPRFAVFDPVTAKEIMLKRRAVSLDDQFSYRNRQIVYSALEPDIRWGWRDFAVLRLLDVNSGKDRRLTARTKYFSPDLSPDGTRIVAVQVSDKQQASLEIVDSRNGRRILRLFNPDHYFFSYPKFLNDTQVVAAVRDGSGRMAIAIFNTGRNEQALLTTLTRQVIGFLSVSHNRIFFSASFQGNDRLFVLEDGKIFTTAENDQSTGAYQIAATSNHYAWTNFTSAGFRLRLDSGTRFLSAPVSFERFADPPGAFHIAALQEPPYRLPEPFPAIADSSRPYSKSFRLFNFHSWRPYVNDPDYTISLVGENVLNTFQSEIYAGYNRNEQYKRLGADVVYGGLFPLINGGVEYQLDRNGFFRNQKVYWNELAANAGLSVPLNLSRGLWLRSLQAGSNLTYHQRYFRGMYKDSFDTRGYLTIDPYISFVNQMQSGVQQIYPSFAQSVTLQYDRAVTTLTGNQWLASGYFYFPGLSRTQSLVVSAAYQARDDRNEIRFSNSFPFSRGYSGENFYRMFRLGANYHFPIAYPDWGFANLVYFLRIRANAFFDYTGVPAFASNGPGVSTEYRSVGTELYFDTKWWNQLPVSFGIRFSHLIDPDYEGRSANQWELILPLNLLTK